MLGINWTPEGKPLRWGLNFYAKKDPGPAGFWLRIALRYRYKVYYFRYRSGLLPHYLYKEHQHYNWP